MTKTPREASERYEGPIYSIQENTLNAIEHALVFTGKTAGGSIRAIGRSIEHFLHQLLR